MALIRLLSGWLVVTMWLLGWEAMARREPGGPGLRGVAARTAGEALLLTLLGGLWFGSLGAGQWWLVFGLVGALREWPGAAAVGQRSRWRSQGPMLGVRLLRVFRSVAAGGILAWLLGPA